MLSSADSFFVKFIYSEKATKFCEIFTLLLTGTSTLDKSKVKISQNFVAFTDRNFVDKCSQQVMHFDHEATY